jgi:hypothetical protein
MVRHDARTGLLAIAGWRVWRRGGGEVRRALTVIAALLAALWRLN